MKNVIVEKAKPEDAEAVLNYLRQIGGETDNLTFGSEGLPFTAEEEAEYINNIIKSESNVMLFAKRNGQIIGDASLDCLARRMSHRGVIGISVVKDEWGKGIGSMLMQKIIDHAKSCNIEIISLEVRSDNDRAINLYKKFGFQKIGTFAGFFKIEDELIDFDLMNLYL